MRHKTDKLRSATFGLAIFHAAQTILWPSFMRLQLFFIHLLGAPFDTAFTRFLISKPMNSPPYPILVLAAAITQPVGLEGRLPLSLAPLGGEG